MYLVVLKHRLFTPAYTRSGSRMWRIQVAVFMNWVENEKHKNYEVVAVK